jgi:hypothetical protein
MTLFEPHLSAPVSGDSTEEKHSFCWYTPTFLREFLVLVSIISIENSCCPYHDDCSCYQSVIFSTQVKKVSPVKVMNLGMIHSFHVVRHGFVLGVYRRGVKLWFCQQCLVARNFSMPNYSARGHRLEKLSREASRGALNKEGQTS